VTPQAWYGARKGFRRIKGSIPLGQLGGDRVVLSKDLKDTLLHTGRIEPYRRTGWAVEKDEKDPFDNKKALYVASALAVGDSSSDWAIRCIEGRVSMLVNMRTTGAVANSGADVSIAVPGLPVRAEIGVVLASTSSETSVQFGSEYTIDYLSGAKNVSVRLDIQGVRITEDFPVGPDLDGVVARALKACHKLQR
jgi:hypothetical protein